MTAPTLLPYQDRWVGDRSPLKIAEKSRRIGLSWAEAYGAVMHAAEDRGNVYYQAYDKEMTRGFIDDCAWWAEELDKVTVAAVDESIIDLGDKTAVQTFRLRLRTGREILSMTSAPRAFRSKGRPGDLGIIDEAAFVDNLDEVLKAALAFLTWGGRIHVISTHNGEASPFNILLRDVRDGRQPGSIHTTTFRTAIDEGLCRRIFEITGREWSAEAEAEWEAGIRRTYGHRGAEELDCIPSAGSGAWLTWKLIGAAERQAAACTPEHFDHGVTWIGVDVARRNDLWVAAVFETVGDVLWMRQMEVRKGISFSEQRQIVRELAERYRPTRIAVDQTGMGEAVVEQLQEDHGSLRVPEGMEIEFEGASATGVRSDLYRDLLTYIDASLSKAVLGQTLTTETSESGGGAYALGQIHDEVRHDIERSDARQLAATLTRDVARPIVQLNRGPRAAYPRILIGREEQRDPKMLADAAAKLVPLGLRILASEVRGALGLSEPEDGDEVLERAPAPAEIPPGLDEDDDDDTAAAAGAADPPPAPPAEARPAGGQEPRDEPAGDDPEDTVDGLSGQTRDQVGPLIDGWLDPVREFIGQADSLDAVRQWIDAQGVDAIDVTNAADRLREALATAELAGRYDIEETPVEPVSVALASAAAQHARLPFAEQIAFFRDKLNLPTAAWTDIWQAMHDRAFVVAGAARDDLLADLRSAVDSAVADGTTIARFRRDFDSIVKKHGWSYKGGRDWRTRVIYDTNLRTSYAAGRYRQMKEIVDRRPFWRYRHSHASEHPREEHLAWDRLILRHDDPWWGTHAPPNGWGCKCYIEALSERDLERLGKSGPDRAPEVKMRTVTVGVNGPSPRTVEVPDGIDPGWAYAPGQSGIFDDTGSAGE